MSKYNPDEFIATLTKKMNGKGFPACPCCGGLKFTTTQNLASILIGDDKKSVNLGPNIPAGMVICENCGRMEFFALGALGLLNVEEHDGSGQ